MAVQAADVRTLRRKMGWSTYALAEKIGCNQSTISRIENGAKISGTIAKALERLVVESESREAA